MALTEAIIATWALQEVRSKGVSALSDRDSGGSGTNIELTERYAQVRDNLLEKYHWKFAKRRDRLLSAGSLNNSALTITITGNTDPTADTIVRNTGSFLDDGWRSGDRITLTGSDDNNKTYNVDTAEALTLTLDTYEAATTETLTNDTNLVMYAQPASRWNYKYVRPSDALNIVDIDERLFDFRQFNGYASYYDGEGLTPIRVPIWDIEGNYIVTNEIDDNNQILVDYVEKVTDVTLFTPLFVRLLVLELAMTLVSSEKADLAAKSQLMEQARRERLDHLQQMGSEGNPTEKRYPTSWQKSGNRGSRSYHGGRY